MSDRAIVTTKRTFLTGLALVALTVGAFWPVLRNDFVSYDDGDYVTENAHVLRGISGENLRWAFEPGHAGNWHPVTWVSHMADVELFGVNPAAHHAVSVTIHALTAVLLMIFLARATGLFWPSAFTAALFALHPLRVESVAWVAERKDVLSGLFFVLTIWGYAAYAERKQRGNLGAGTKSGQEAVINRGKAAIYYGASLTCFALGLMSKPMLVTVPFVLLLLDYWPLGRARGESKSYSGTEGGRARGDTRPYLGLVLEKVPFFVLAGASCVVTFYAQNTGGAVASLDALPLEFRLSNAFVSCARYIGKFLVPLNLSVIYPLPTPKEWPIAWTLGSLLLVVTASALVIWQGRKRAYLPVGWLWFVGTLVPVIGIVQVGQQAMADRYTYIPSIGLCVIAAWGAAELFGRWTAPRQLIMLAAAMPLAGCFLLTRAQTAHWQNSITLFAHAVSVTRNNAIAHNNFGSSLLTAGRLEEAEWHLQEALRIRPDYPEARVNLALLRDKQGRGSETAALLEQSVRDQPTSGGHYNLANLLAQQGRLEEAELHYRAALRMKPEFVEALYNLGSVKLKQNQFEEAVDLYVSALRLRPNYAEVRLSLGALLASRKEFDKAIDQFKAVLALQPENPDARFNLAAALESKGDLGAAATHYADAVRLRPSDSQGRLNFGLVLLKQGNTPEAASQFRALLKMMAPAEDDLKVIEASACPTPANSNAVAQVHHLLALTLHSQGRLQDALPHYRRAAVLNPMAPAILNDLAWILATNPDDQVRNGPEALRLAQAATELTAAREAAFLGTLAAAYAELGRFSEAETAAEKAIQLASASGQQAVVTANQEFLELYRAGKPVRR